MEYTIGQLAELAGVSTRTLRYYDQIGLLEPNRLSNNGYRLYGAEEVDLLQQILFFRAVDMSLSEIRNIVSESDYNPDEALRQHLDRLKASRDRLDGLIESLKTTLSYRKGESVMTDQQKFEALKKQRVDENERSFGKEIREAYGEKAVKESNKRFLRLDRDQVEQMERIEEDLVELLRSACSEGKLTEAISEDIYGLHRKWLSYTWKEYSPAAHRGLAQMYEHDERFRAYYDQKAGCDAAGYLIESIKKHTA